MSWNEVYFKMNLGSSKVEVLNPSEIEVVVDSQKF